jgi:hypothetical protein
MTVLRFLRVTVLAAFVGCGHAPSEPASPRSERASPPSDGVPTAGSVNAGVASAGPVEPVSATVEVPEPVHENALYLGSADGPIVRIAEDGTVTSLGPEARTTHLALGLDGVVYAASSRQVVAVVGDALESVGGVGPMNFTMVAARSRDDVWAAAAGGVAHFDGHAWTTVDEPFAGQVVRDLAFDSAGVLWVLTRNAIYRHVDGSFEELPAMTGSTLLTGFVPNASGGLDVYNYRGVDRYDGQAWSMVPINWVERSHEGRLAMTTLGHAAFGGGVLALSGGHDAGICLKVPEVQYFGSTSMAELQLPASRVTDVAVDGRGRPWYATNGGLLLLERFGSPRVTRWWPIHGFPALVRAPSQLLVVGNGPTTLPEVREPVASRVRGTLGPRYANAPVRMCASVRRRGAHVECEMNEHSQSAVADARGRFVFEGVFPAAYALLVSEGGRWFTTSADCCSPRQPGDEVVLDRLSVNR